MSYKKVYNLFKKNLMKSVNNSKVIDYEYKSLDESYKSQKKKIERKFNSHLKNDDLFEQKF